MSRVLPDKRPPMADGCLHLKETPFEEYRRRLIELHRLIRIGKGDGEEADDLREEMDPFWAQLTQEEIREVEMLSCRLYRENAH